jgi:lipopolysaccharide export system permease protein
MAAVNGTLARYFGLRFLGTVIAVFVGIFALTMLIDYVEMTRRASGIANISAIIVAKASMYRVPQITETLMPFCILVGAMYSYLNFSRRLELVVARAAGMSAWQFIAPAVLIAFVLGIGATTIYNPISAILQERSKRYEAELFGKSQGAGAHGSSFWVGQRTAEGQAIINAKSSREQGFVLSGVSVFLFDTAGQFSERLEAKTAVLESSAWQLKDVHVYPMGGTPRFEETYSLKTNLSREQVRESFATPETVPFWQLPQYIGIAERAGLLAAGYRLQFQKLLAKPFLLAAMVFLAGAVSLRSFRFGGIMRMVLSGVTAGFLLYVSARVLDDMSKAELLSPVAAAWMPVLIGSLIGIVALLYQEDG